MQIITTIGDIRRLVSEWSGGESYVLEPKDNEAAIEKITRQISSEAQEAGLSYGDDWTSLLQQVEVNNCIDWLEGDRASITEAE